MDTKDGNFTIELKANLKKKARYANTEAVGTLWQWLHKIVGVRAGNVFCPQWHTSGPCRKWGEEGERA